MPVHQSSIFNVEIKPLHSIDPGPAPSTNVSVFPEGENASQNSSHWYVATKNTNPFQGYISAELALGIPGKVTSDPLGFSYAQPNPIYDWSEKKLYNKFSSDPILTDFSIYGSAMLGDLNTAGSDYRNVAWISAADESIPEDLTLPRIRLRTQSTVVGTKLLSGERPELRIESTGAAHTVVTNPILVQEIIDPVTVQGIVDPVTVQGSVAALGNGATSNDPFSIALSEDFNADFPNAKPVYTTPIGFYEGGGFAGYNFVNQGALLVATQNYRSSFNQGIVEVTNSNNLLYPANDVTLYLNIRNNDSTGKITICFNDTAAFGEGIVIGPGESYEFGSNIPNNDIYAIGDIPSNPNIVINSNF